MSDVNERLDNIESALADIQKFIAAFNIDKQLFIRRDNEATSGRGTKVTVNKDGIVVGVDDLNPADVPTLPMSKINGLSEALSDTISRKQLEIINSRIDKVLSPGKVVKTGTKVNVDENGLVQGVTDLIEEDIPQLSMSKINGLSEALSVLSNNVAKKEVPQVEMIQETFKPLRESDLPESVLERISNLQSNMANTVTLEQLEQLAKVLNQKTDSISSEPGVYTKVQVNEYGQFVTGDKLEKSDLPKLSIPDIEGLEQYTKNAVDIAEFNDVKASISSIESRMTTVSELLTLRGKIDQLLSDPTINNLQTQVNELDGKVSSMLYDNSVNQEIDSIREQLITLSSRITELEKK